MNLTEQLDALLPQTQCTRCGFPACRPYAEALASASTSANLCEPGGAALIPRLAAAAGLPILPAAHPPAAVRVAWIREEDCIGCARCLPACPVDAIVGARRFAHTVIEAECTGCTLCLAPCPVDCIELIPPSPSWSPPSAEANRARYQAHLARSARRAAERTARLAASDPVTRPALHDGASTPLAATDPAPTRLAERRAAMIAAARAAAAARRGDA